MDALALLRLQIEWGADEALEEAPVDRARPPAGSGPRRPERIVAPMAAAPMVAAPMAAALAGGGDARALADAASTLAALRAAIAGFEGCGLRATASSLVFADGNPAAGLLIVGDAPSAAEDRGGSAFDGPTGAYLDRMLHSIGLDRQAALLTPLIPWRPPGGRPPSASEVAACLPFLHRLVVLAAPRRIVLLGRLAVRTLLTTVPRRRDPAWVPMTVPGMSEPLPALAMPGLEGLVAGPAERRAAWAALRLLRRTLETDLAG